MKLVQHPRELAPLTRKVCLAIGMFDGVHLGHQQVIRQTITDAQHHGAWSVVVTFDRHPASIVAPDRAPALIYSLQQKIQVLRSLGVDSTLLIPFDRSFSEIPAEEFIRRLAEDFGQIHGICVGSHFTFGHRRLGNVPLLKSLGQNLRFTVHGLAAVSLDGQIVSSTRIREAIRAGDLDAASQMLGRPYSIRGFVIKGDQLGRKLGTPTANLDVQRLALPPAGVYAAFGEFRGKVYPAVVNLGSRPTVADNNPQTRLEAHLLDFAGNLYDQELEIVFAERLRDERHFPSLQALTVQIQADIAQARQILA